MPATPRYGFPYPVNSDSPNGPLEFAQLATQVEAKLGIVDDAVAANSVSKSAAFYATSSQSVNTGTDTKIQFPATERSSAYITPSLTGNQNFTVNQSGVYHVSFCGRMAISSGATWLGFIAPSASSAAAGRLLIAGAGSTPSLPTVALSGDVALTSTSVYSFYLYQETGNTWSTLPTGGHDFRLSFTYLGS
jgi:hypothetical protein